MTEHEPQLEKTTNHSLVDIFSLSEKEEKEIREKIERDRGYIKLIVHPFYTDPAIIPDEKERKRIEAVAWVIRRHFSLPPDSAPFLVVLQPAEKIDTLREWADSLPTKNNRVAYIKTNPNGSTPFAEPGDTRTDNARWESLIEKLKKLGVKKLISAANL